MLRIVCNWLLLAVLPFAVGLLARLLLRRAPRAFVLSGCLVAAALALWIAAFFVPTYGSEAIGVTALMVTFLAAGACAAGAALRLRR